MNEIQQKLDNELTDLEKIMNKIDNFDDSEFNNIYAKLKNYENNINKINSTLKKILLIKDNLNIVINNYLLNKINKKNIIINKDEIFNYTNINTNIKSNNQSNLNSKPSYVVNYKNITNNDKYNNYSFTKFAVINISEKDIDLIENSPIYYINETQQYCIKINNNLIMGNIANIYNKKDNKTKVNKCRNCNCTRLFYNKLCNYYHDDTDRNFTNYSWNHVSKNKLGQYDLKGNILNIKKHDIDNTRFIGSLDTLMEDLPFSSINEKKLRSSQLIHDILLYMILSEYLS